MQNPNLMYVELMKRPLVSPSLQTNPSGQEWRSLKPIATKTGAAHTSPAAFKEISDSSQNVDDTRRLTQ